MGKNAYIHTYMQSIHRNGNVKKKKKKSRSTSLNIYNGNIKLITFFSKAQSLMKTLGRK